MTEIEKQKLCEILEKIEFLLADVFLVTRPIPGIGIRELHELRESIEKFKGYKEGGE